MYHSQFHERAPSGLQAMASLAWGSHIGQFFRSADDLCDVLVPYFLAGLQNNERCLWVTAAPLDAEAARAALRRVVPDLDARELRGDIEILDGNAFYDRRQPLAPAALVDGLLQREQDAIAAGYNGVRTNGNCDWVGSTHWDDFCDYETRVHTAIQNRKLICMCSFSHDGFAHSRLADIADRHDLVVPPKKAFRESLNDLEPSPAVHESAYIDAELDAAVISPRQPTVDDVIATPLLFTRPARPANFKAETEALASLIQVMSESPDKVLQKLVDTGLALCGAGSAGISIDESGTGDNIFRWRATAGRYTEYLDGTMPRDFSPCGEVLDRNEPILMINMVKYYGYVATERTAA